METISAVNANVILYSFYLLNYHLQQQQQQRPFNGL